MLPFASMIAVSWLQNLGAIVGLFFVGVAILTAVFVLARSGSNRETIDTFATTNEEYRRIHADQQHQIEANEAKFNAQLLAQEHRFKLEMAEADTKCQASLSELRGQLKVLTSDLGRQIASEIVTAIGAAKHE